MCVCICMYVYICIYIYWTFSDLFLAEIQGVSETGTSSAVQVQWLSVELALIRVFQFLCFCQTKEPKTRHWKNSVACVGWSSAVGLHVNRQTNFHTHTKQQIKFLVIKLTRCTNFSNLFFFWNKTLHVSDSSSVHHQKFFTLHTAMVYVIQVCWQLANRIRTELQFRPDPAGKLSADGQRNCPKHVEFCSKNKFEKLVYLVGLIIRIYHDARSPERQILL